MFYPYIQAPLGIQFQF